MSEVQNRPIIGITMGDPVGIGPELVCKLLSDPGVYEFCRPLVIGDAGILSAAGHITGFPMRVSQVRTPSAGYYRPGRMDVLSLTGLDPEKTVWARPTALTGRAMIDYIKAGIDMAMDGSISALVTCPINKTAMKMAGSRFHGHTELLATRTSTSKYAMMMTGSRLRVVLATIHIPVSEVPRRLSLETVYDTIKITDFSLKQRFALGSPRIAVAGLNPHAGEQGMFGSEDLHVIGPAVSRASDEGVDAEGPLPPDTVFYKAVEGCYDAVVCMYHDQGLIPFKLIHFSDGVNTTLGLPIIRTSVDHGTAYDIAGRGVADPGSLREAVRAAAFQAVNQLGGDSGAA